MRKMNLIPMIIAVIIIMTLVIQLAEERKLIRDLKQKINSIDFYFDREQECYRELPDELYDKEGTPYIKCYGQMGEITYIAKTS